MTAKQAREFARTILLVDDDRDFRWAVANVLKAAGYDVVQAQDGEEGLSILEADVPSLILLDCRMPGSDGLEVAAEMRRRIPAVPIVMITAYAEVKSAVSAMKMGVYDYITKPVDNNDLLFTIRRAMEKQDLEHEIEHLRELLGERTALFELMGKSDEVKKLVELVEKVAPTPFTALIEGESGTGKELVARAIHNLSASRDGPFVAVDCGAIPETLIESELFGYMKGAFTGAHADKPGQFELAQGGTLFLDEVGNLSYTAQQKLLRAMQERCIQRLGANEPRPVQVRIIAATNQSLEKDVDSGTFRSDLYFRLKEFVIRIPALKDRKEDIPYLAKKFTDEVQRELKKKCRGFTKEALGSLMAYPWPGNVRELRNVIRQAVLLSEEDGFVQSEHLMVNAVSVSDTAKPDKALSPKLDRRDRSLKEMVKAVTDSLEKRAIQEALDEAAGNKSEVARVLGIDYKTLLRKIKLHNIQ
jgi:DNA-binding NtrC family response regulator